jgi:hypothetical protein
LETTTNYNLSKPGASDYVDISVLNANMDTVDTQLKNAQSHRESSGIHVTAAQKTKWDGYETVHTLTHAKTGTVHALTGLNGAAGILSCQFKATAGYNAALDTLTVDGVSYTIKLSNGEKAEDNLFVSGAVVPCIVDTAGKTVNFKAGGGGYKKGDVVAPENLEPVYGPISTDLFVGKAALHGITLTGTSISGKPAITKNEVIWVANGSSVSKTTNGIRTVKTIPSSVRFLLAVVGDDTNDDDVYVLYRTSNTEGGLIKYRVSTATVVWTQMFSEYVPSGGLVWKNGHIYGAYNSIVFSIGSDGSNFTSQDLNYGGFSDICLDKDGNVYVCSNSGYIVKINETTMGAIWAKQIESNVDIYQLRFINAWDYIYTGKSDTGKLYRCSLNGSVLTSKAISSGSEWACPIPNASGTSTAILLSPSNDNYLKIVDANFSVVTGTSNLITSNSTGGTLGGGLTIGNDGNIWLVKKDDIVSLTGPLQGYTVKEVVK